MGVCQSNPESEMLRKNSGGATGKNGAGTDQMVKVQALTWMRDSHGLFDYESTQTIQQTIKLRGQDHTLFRNNGEVAALENDKDELPLPLGHVTLHEAGYWLQPANMRILGRNGDPKKLTIGTMGLNEAYDDEESMWVVARHLNHVSDRGYRIQKGDYIKFGRVRYRVKELNNGTSVDGSPKLAKSLSQYGAFKIQDKLVMDMSPERSPQIGHDAPPPSDIRSCRICLSDVVEGTTNPLVCPCDCSGTMKYVHIKCLQQWLTNKTQCRVSGSVTSVVWKNMNCELCKKELPESCLADSDNKEHDLIELPRPDPSTNTPYLMLEVLSREKKNGGKGLQILEFNSKPSIKLGRGQDCDLRIPDISVSRFHALIRYDAGEGEFYLVDNNSKFGTLILVQRPIPLRDEFRKVTVQVGRSIFSVSLEKADKKWATFTAACMNAISIEKDDSIPGGSNKQKREAPPTVMSGSHLSASHQPMVMSLPQSPNLREEQDDNEGIPDEHYDVPRSGSQYNLMHNSQ